MGILPGCSVQVDKLLPLVQQAVVKGFVTQAACDDVFDIFSHGSTLYCDYDALHASLSSTKVFRNYPTALGNRRGVSKGLRKRVEASQTMCLGQFNSSDVHLLPERSLVFPLGAVPKKGPDGLPLEEWRPTSDHTKSTFNQWCNPPSHSLTATDDVADMLLPGYSMAVADIHNAFALIPLSPLIWKFMFFTWYNVYDDNDNAIYLYANLFSDFGGAGTPEVFRRFFVDVLLNVARAESIISPCRLVPTHVDDFSIIDKEEKVANLEMSRLQIFFGELGVLFKNGSFSSANKIQLMVGFIWNSTDQTRELTDARRERYICDWRRHAAAKSMTLHERQSEPQADRRMHQAWYQPSLPW